ncbi:hypothetical protein [Geothrix mesophila]|uniref:hypothetical protein n=1 Tax=Geothrix mesophila TaxID=2922723 RepID=UPI001FABF753|nr:hypothetical protein [Geothrix sp. SG198]
MTKLVRALACLIGTAAVVQAQGAPSDPWAPVRFLVGEWQGAITGDQGTGTATRRYRFILSGQFLQERSMASFPPQPLHPDGTVASHASFLAYDTARKVLVFRLLRQEAFSGTFVLSPAQSQSTKLVFESVQLDSAATSKARETLEQISPEAYVETFEVAEAGKPFSVRSRIQFKRRQP